MSKLTDQPFMRFEIREKVKHFKENQSFQSLSSLELHPIVKVYDSKHHIDITGHLVLNGEFERTPLDNNWQEEADQADAIHHGSFFTENEIADTFQYQIPISIQIQHERVNDPNDVFVTVEFFDYEVLSDQEIEIVAQVQLLGVHPDPKQETPVDVTEEFETEYPVDVTFENDANIMKEEETEVEQVQANPVDDNVDEVEAKEVIDEKVDETTENSETIETVETVETPLPAPTMKIGIQGKNRESNDDQKSSTNPLYSLLKKEKREETNVIKEEQVVEEKAEEVIEEKELAANITEEESKQKINTEDVETDINPAIEKVEQEVTEEIGEDSEEQSTKDMLFSLLKGNEENKYTLKIYFVQKEDTLEQIAEKYQLRTADLMNHNHLQSDELEEGQILFLPIR